MLQPINRIGSFCSARFSPLRCENDMRGKILTPSGAVFGYCSQHRDLIIVAVKRAGYEARCHLSEHPRPTSPTVEVVQPEVKQTREKPPEPEDEAADCRDPFRLTDLGMQPTPKDPATEQREAAHRSNMEAFKRHLYRNYPSDPSTDPWEDGDLAIHVLRDLEERALGWKCQGPHVVVKMVIDKYQEMVEERNAVRQELTQVLEANRFLQECIEAYQRELTGNS